MDANLIGVVAGTIALVGSCSAGVGPSAPDPTELTEPITSRALAARAMTHLRPSDRGYATGGHDASESGDEEVHFATWSLTDEIDFFVAVARAADGADDFDGTCAAAEKDEATTSCREVTVGGQKVVVISSSEDVTGGIYTDGITWAAASRRPNGDRVVATLMLSEMDPSKEWRKREDLPIAVDTLVDIAADPLIASETSAEAIARGRKLEDFKTSE